MQVVQFIEQLIEADAEMFKAPFAFVALDLAVTDENDGRFQVMNEGNQAIRSVHLAVDRARLAENGVAAPAKIAEGHLATRPIHAQQRFEIAVVLLALDERVANERNPLAVT